MVKCKKCGKTYDEDKIVCFESAGISLDCLCCVDCMAQALVRTYTSSKKEA